MFFVSITFLTILIPSIQSVQSSLELKFSPDEKYYPSSQPVDISCKILNSTTETDAAQLWHVNLATDERTRITPSLIDSPGEDSPLIFKQNTNKRIQYLDKNYLRIRNLQLEDSARYECACPDCSEELGTVNKTLQVMKITEPKWNIKSEWRLQEGAAITIKCTADDFYPFVDHKIILGHYNIKNFGRHVVIQNDNTYSHNFSWEAIVTPLANWHNTKLVCIVVQGNIERRTEIYLEILSTPRFEKCDEKQHVNSTKGKVTIECTYAGNPEPGLTWYRQNDNKPLVLGNGISIERKAHNHGRYTSMITFDRDILDGMPTTTTTGALADSRSQSKVVGNTYYEQLVNVGFTVKLTNENYEEKGSRNIIIVQDANQVPSASIANSTTDFIEKSGTESIENSAIQNLSASIVLFSALIILCMF